ncbi:MAG: hypothetical protein K940chlam2_01773, partial [Chlamydiae bacterium]|nr:hypothetical protein [Chlamydiota bacterium]
VGEHGPLLAYYKNEPVTLLPERGHYSLIIPKEEAPMAITKSVAADISPLAYTLYPPLPEDMGTMQALFQALFSHKMRDYFYLFLAGVLATTVALFVPISNKILFDNVIPHYNLSLLGQVLLGLMAAAAGSAAFLVARSFVGLRLNAKITHYFQMTLWDRILKLPTQFFKTMANGDLIQRTMIFNTLRRLVDQNSVIIIFDSLFASLYFFIALYYSWKLALVGLGTILLATLLAILLAFLKVKWDKALLASDANINAFLISVVQGVDKLRLTASESFFFSHWATKYAENQTLSLKSRFLAVISATLNKVIFPLFSLVIFALIIHERTSDISLLTLGDFLALSAALTPFFLATLSFLNLGTSMISLIPFWQRVRPLLTSALEAKATDQEPEKLQGKIALKDIYFRYRANAPYVLEGLSLETTPGDFVALVGHSGSGKSTICRLLVGFETPVRGDIHYDEWNLQELSLSQMREQISFVMQQKAIFMGSFFENITCGKPYSYEEIQKALALSTLDQDMHRFPSGLNTLLPSGGANLSAGERQKLLLARALIRNPQILILDEGLNSLQSATQQQILETLKTLKITRIIATHQVNILKAVDQILILENGKISSQGSYDQLVKENPHFLDLIKQQTL